MPQVFQPDIPFNEGFFQNLAEQHVTRFYEEVAQREWALKRELLKDKSLDIFVYNYIALKILNLSFEVLEKNMVGVKPKSLEKVKSQ